MLKKITTFVMNALRFSLNYVATPAWHLNLNLFSKGKGRSRGAQSKYGQRRLPELVWKSVWLEIVITVV